MEENNTIQQKPTVKINPLFIVIIILSIIAVVGLSIAVAGFINYNNQQKAFEDTQKSAESSTIETSKLSFLKNDEYSEILNIFVNVDNMILPDDLTEILELGNIDQSYVHIDKNTGKCYIASSEIILNKDYSDSEIEFITFDYVVDEEDAENNRLSGFTYHSYHDGHHSYIQEDSEEGFTHYYDGITSSFEEKNDAIEDYIGKTQE